jgi:xanthine dehydrogenase accessory factor
VAGLARGSDVVVMTHSHALDQEVVEAALRRGDELGYVGVIGSRTKRARFTQRLLARGLPPERVAALVCPIGLEGVGGKLPAEIALAVAAQLLQRRRAGLVPPRGTEVE